MTEGNRHSKIFRLVLLVVLILSTVTGCNGNNEKNNIVGKWMSQQDQQVIEFMADGTYKGVQNNDYTYELLKDNQLKILSEENQNGNEAIVMTYTLEGDILKTTYEGSTLEWHRVRK